MAQNPPKKKKLPKDIMDRPGREVMERVFGKRVMKEVDKIVAERSDDKDGKDEEPMP